MLNGGLKFKPVYFIYLKETKFSLFVSFVSDLYYTTNGFPSLSLFVFYLTFLSYYMSWLSNSRVNPLEFTCLGSKIWLTCIQNRSWAVSHGLGVNSDS